MAEGELQEAAAAPMLPAGQGAPLGQGDGHGPNRSRMSGSLPPRWRNGEQKSPLQAATEMTETPPWQMLREELSGGAALDESRPHRMETRGDRSGQPRVLIEGPQ